MRLKAIFCCLYFGITPWWVYQKACHYEGMSYWNHLILNMEQVRIWLTGEYSFGDLRFETVTNPNWKIVLKNLCRYTYVER